MTQLAAERVQRLLPPVEVIRQSAANARFILLRAAAGADRFRSYDWELCDEQGAVRKGHAGRCDRVWRNGACEFRIRLPFRPKLGYHDLRVVARVGNRELAADQTRIIVPARCYNPFSARSERQRFGLWANLYSVRSNENWGFGDFGDLAQIGRWAGELGAAFVGINPLHVLQNHGDQVSPYSPLSRIFLNPLYLHVPAIPEFRECPDARRLFESASFQQELEALKSMPRIDYERVLNLKRSILEALFENFTRHHVGRGTPRGKAFEDFVNREGNELDRFATFCTLNDTFGSGRGGPRRRQEWPAAFRSPNSPGVASWRRENQRRIDFHRFVQFELDRQLRMAEDSARSTRLRWGLIHDLAIGVSADSYDVWAHGHLFAKQANVGAPPDAYAPHGQDWQLPALNPRSLAADRYRYWIRVLRSSMSRGQALRIDHVMGLLRQFWIPRGRPACEGAYVAFPWDALSGIVALESLRHRTVIIGEDLGTTPPGFSRRLAQRGILSTRVMFFERTRTGAFRPPSRYSNRALVSATTHDFGPLGGYWAGQDLNLRRRLGLISNAVEFHRRSSERDKELGKLFGSHAFQRALRKAHLLAANFGALFDHPTLERRNDTGRTAVERKPTQFTEVAYSEFCFAVHSFLRASSAPLIAIMLDDLAGETEPVNLPGVLAQVFSSWTRPMSATLETLRADPAVRFRLGAWAPRQPHRTRRMPHSG